jgi:hypothetical protein
MRSNSNELKTGNQESELEKRAKMVVNQERIPSGFKRQDSPFINSIALNAALSLKDKDSEQRPQSPEFNDSLWSDNSDEDAEKQ